MKNVGSKLVFFYIVFLKFVEVVVKDVIFDFFWFGIFF